MAWHTKRSQGRDEPSPVVVGDLMLVSNMQGMLTAYETATGKELWRQKLVEKDAITAAPITSGGKAYFTFESGETVVVEPSEKECKIVSRNTVGQGSNELFRASLAAVGGKVYVRSDRVLYCVK
jgi:outer membrane protein assembly factor BamB